MEKGQHRHDISDRAREEIWERILETLVNDTEPAIQSAPSRGRGKRRQSEHVPRKKLNTKIHLAADAHGMPVRFFVSLPVPQRIAQLQRS